MKEKPKPFKIKFIVNCEYKMFFEGEIKEESSIFHTTKIQEIYESSNKIYIYIIKTNEVIELSDNFANLGSGWVYKIINNLNIEIDKFHPISGSGTFTNLPKNILNKNAVINMQNINANECFKWSFLRSCFTTKNHPERISKILKEKEKIFNWKDIKYPIDIKKGPNIFEKNNPGYKICIIGYDDSQKEKGGFFPLRPIKKIQMIK